MEIKVLDVFSGCGGISWGLHQAGFRILAGIDNDGTALKTFKRNHDKSQILNADLAVLRPQECLDKLEIKAEDIDFLVGGPPCQGFSKNVPRKQRFLEDERNLLIGRFLDFVDLIRPKTVLMENVAEIVNAYGGAFREEILGILTAWGYSATVTVLDAADYGVPQHRRRAFFLASRCHETLIPLSSTKHISVWEAIGDLPSIQHGESAEYYQSEAFSEYQVKMRGTMSHLYNHTARPLKPIQYERMASIKAGEGAKQLPEHLKPKSYYSGAYGRLTKDMVARTLTRWLFHSGSGRFGHPVDIRTITIREAARLQSFSDDFIFEGSFTQASSQIGNSVPPLLVKVLGEAIKQEIIALSRVSESL